MSARFPFSNYEVDLFQENIDASGERCSSYIMLSQIFMLVNSNILLYAILSETYHMCIPL